MSRKTINIEFLVNKANYFLAHSEPEHRERRLGVASMIELALHETGNYAGYLHLETAGRHTPNGSPPSHIVFDDDSRRAYMLKGRPYPNTRI